MWSIYWNSCVAYILSHHGGLLSALNKDTEFFCCFPNLWDMYRHRIRSSLIKEDFEELRLRLQKPDKESCWWVAVPSGTSWEANSCGRCFRPHCAAQARARCTEIRGDLDPTVFSRWPPAQQPPRPAAGQGGDQGRALGVKIGDVSAGGARSGKEVDPGSRPHLHPAEAPADPPAFFDPAWSIWLLRRVGTVTSHAMIARRSARSNLMLVAILAEIIWWIGSSLPFVVLHCRPCYYKNIARIANAVQCHN